MVAKINFGMELDHFIMQFLSEGCLRQKGNELTSKVLSGTRLLAGL